MLSHTTNFARTQPLGKNLRFVPSAASHSLDGTLDMMGAPMSFARNSEIYGENEPAEFLYKLVSGAVRTSKILNDGRRQIGEFYLPGDIFGLEVGTEHAFSAEAIADAKVIVIKRSAVEALAARDNDVARQLWATTGRELQRMQEHILIAHQERPRARSRFPARDGRTHQSPPTRWNCRCRGKTSPTIWG